MTYTKSIPNSNFVHGQSLTISFTTNLALKHLCQVGTRKEPDGGRAPALGLTSGFFRWEEPSALPLGTPQRARLLFKAEHLKVSAHPLLFLWCQRQKEHSLPLEFQVQDHFRNKQREKKRKQERRRREREKKTFGSQSKNLWNESCAGSKYGGTQYIQSCDWEHRPLPACYRKPRDVMCLN